MLEGYFIDGKATGHARWLWADGLCFIGALKNYKYHGKGIKIMGDAYKDIVYQGIWKND